MKIAISAMGPNLNALAEPHFEYSRYFVVVDSETMRCEIFDNMSSMMAENIGISAAQFLINKRVDAVITGTIGPDETAFMGTAGMQIFLCEKCTVNEAFNCFKEKRLKRIET
jgi:predicted Fe-Mo cluster-binding NifX family protein